MNSPLLEKSLDFATNIVLFYEDFAKTRKDTTIAKQLLRSATSVGANINELFTETVKRILFPNCIFRSKKQVKAFTGSTCSNEQN